MTPQDIISNHPQFEVAVQTARIWLSGSAMSPTWHGYDKGQLEDTLVRELLSIVDISTPYAIASNVDNYLKGNIDRYGKIVNRGIDGLIYHIKATVPEALATGYPPMSGNPIHQLRGMFAGWPPRQMVGGESDQKINSFAGHFYQIAHKACIVMNEASALQHARAAIENGNQTLDEAFNYFNYCLGESNPSGYDVVTKDSVEYQRVLQEVTRQIEAGGLIRMPWQQRNYADEIYACLAPSYAMSEHEILGMLTSIICRETETARGTFVIGDKIDPFANLDHVQKRVAEQIRQLLATQGESWPLKEIAAYAIELCHEAGEEGGWLTVDKVREATALKCAVRNTVQEPIRNIGEAEVSLKSDITIAHEQILEITNAVKDDVEVIAYNNGDSYSFYRNDVLHVMAREYGLSPTGNPLLGSWVLRKLYTGEYVDHDFNRHDLAERQTIKIGK